VVTVHKKHTGALEKALRCLDNDAITSEEIDPLKDDLDYYLVSETCAVCGCFVICDGLKKRTA
jgi:CCR4-NOT transcriptional regulation complex NOT5 subunit